VETEVAVCAKDVILETPNCTRVKMEILKCEYESRNRMFFTKMQREYVRGVRDEVYKVSPQFSSTKCNDVYALTPHDRVIDVEGKPVQLLRPPQNRWED